MTDLPPDQQDNIENLFFDRKSSIKIKRSLLNKHRPLSYVEMSSSISKSNGVDEKKRTKIAPRLTQMHPHHHTNFNLPSAHFSQHSLLHGNTNNIGNIQHRHHHHAHTSPHLSILDIKHFSSNLSMSGGLGGDNEQSCSLSSSSSSSCSSNSNESHLVTTDEVVATHDKEFISRFYQQKFI